MGYHLSKKDKTLVIYCSCNIIQKNVYRNTLFSKVFTMSRLMSDSPPKLQDQVNLRNWRTAPFNQWAFSNVRNLLPTAVILSNNNKKSFEQSFENLSSIKVTTSEKNVQSSRSF